MKTATIVRAAWWLAGLALVLGWGRDTILGRQPAPRELPRADNRTGQPWIAGEFVRDRRIEPGRLPGHLAHASSHVGGDQFTGRAETAWFKASRRTVYVGVAGYPNHRGCALWAEFRDAAGRVTRLDCPLPDPRETWALWEIRRPADAVQVRIVGEDLSPRYAGWVAFSHPFRAWPPELASVYSFFQVIATLALALVLTWGPGLVWCPAGAGTAVRSAWFLGAGPLALAAGGVLIWATGAHVPPPILGTALAAGLWLAVGSRARRRDWVPGGGPALDRALAVAALVTLAVAAKASYSVGSEGELFRGTVSRNFQLSDRIDSRFGFYAVQAAAHGWGPASPITEKFYYPWTFFSRGPLAGLAATPVVMATNGRPPAEHAEAVWSPFDPTGFAAYRSVHYALAATVLVAFFWLLAPLVGPAWALSGCGLVALSPFGLHEVLFTWPKWAATAWLVAAFGFVHAGRPLAAGLSIGVGFLYHPLVLLWAPWLGAWTLGAAPRTWSGIGSHLAWLALGAGALVLPWMALGHVMPHLPDTPFAGQGGFLRYWTLADSQLATWETWLRTRWMNFANTFIPLHLFASDASFAHFRFSSAYETSGPLEKTLFLWWNSLPFALGLGVWIASALAFERGLKLLRTATWLLLVGPALFMVAYWGADPLGLMRECGHPLLLAIVAVMVIVATRLEDRLSRWLAHPARPWLQLPEAWLMFWLAALANPRPPPRFDAHLDPVYLALNALALIGAAAVLFRARRSGAARDPV